MKQTVSGVQAAGREEYPHDSIRLHDRISIRCVEERKPIDRQN